ncbi:MAG: phosphate acetyltransferase [Fibromonadaceae bacterium]|jgi:phosphate acetyltransferase|nr:phosphate acetyltransferase [Fibromonadaceae bacterium]
MINSNFIAWLVEKTLNIIYIMPYVQNQGNATMKHVYILLPAANGVPLGSVADGILETLKKKGLTAAKFIPFGENGIPFAEIRNAIISNCEQMIMEILVDKLTRVSAKNDVVIVEGISTPGIFYKKELHRMLTSAFDADIILVAKAGGKTPENLISNISVEEHFHKSANAFMAGCVFINVEENFEEALRSATKESGLPALAFVHGGENPSKEAVIAGIAEEPWEHILKKKREHRMSPPEFRNFLIKKAQKYKAKIVLPEGAEPRTVRAAILTLERQIAIPILIAKRADVEKTAATICMSLPPDLEIIDPENIAPKYVPMLAELRKSKGMTEEQAKKMLTDSVWVGTMMVKAGDADGLVSGAAHSTADTVRPALTIIKPRKGTSLISSAFFMCLPTQVLVYGDCAINTNPNADDLAQIAIQCADTARDFGIVPRVAMLSYSTGESGKGEDVDKVKEATQKVKELRPDIEIDGPMQYDAAIMESVARTKAPNSHIAGRATVFVFPDLNTGNTTYKAVQRSANTVSIGPMLQGLAKPVNDLSRGALVDDIVYTIAITAVQAGMSR